MKVAEVAAAEITTLPGTCATDELELVRVIVAPPVGAGALSVIIPFELLAADTLLGVKLTDKLTAGVPGVTVKGADEEEPPKLAEMVELASVVTLLVVIANVALVAPAATTTLVGTCAAPVLLLLNVTVAPPAGAAPLSVTVPCALLPPTTLVGFSDSDAATTPFVVAIPFELPPPPQAADKKTIISSNKHQSHGRARFSEPPSNKQPTIPNGANSA